MDSSNILSLLDQLDDEIDDLEESLAPLIKSALAETTSKLPLMDKAKLYVLVTYAIESILFSYLRLNGVKAREHPVFIELSRVKQYFDKIKVTEQPTRRTLTLDKAAAARFLQPGLSAADKDALERAEKLAKERARAHIKFEELSKKIEDRESKEKEESKKRKADKPDTSSTDDESSSDSNSDSDLDSSAQSEEETPVAPAVVTSSRKKRKVDKKPESGSSSGATSAASSSDPTGKSRKKARGNGPKNKRLSKLQKKSWPKGKGSAGAGRAVTKPTE